MTFEYDKTVDAGYICLRKGVKVARTQRLDDSRLIDYDASGEPIGIELLNVKANGVDTSDLPQRAAIERLLSRRKIRLPAQR